MRHGGNGGNGGDRAGRRGIGAWTAAALVAAVVVSGCGSGSDSDDAADKTETAGTAGEKPTSSVEQPTPGAPAESDPQAVWASLVEATAARKSVEYRSVRVSTGDIARASSTRDEAWSWFEPGSRAGFVEYSSDTGSSGIPGRLGACQGTSKWLYNPTPAKWYEPGPKCTIEFRGDGKYIGDGVLPVPGLSPEQARTFVASLAATQDWLTPSVAPVERAGRRYLRLTLDLTPQQVGGGYTENTKYLLQALRSADPDALRRPYLIENIDDASGSAVRAVFWLDPASRLPAYSEVVTTVIDKGRPTGEVRTRRTEYVFGGAEPRHERTRLVPQPALVWPQMGTQAPKV